MSRFDDIHVERLNYEPFYSVISFFGSIDRPIRKSDIPDNLKLHRNSDSSEFSRGTYILIGIPKGKSKISCYVGQARNLSTRLSRWINEWDIIISIIAIRSSVTDSATGYHKELTLEEIDTLEQCQIKYFSHKLGSHLTNDILFQSRDVTPPFNLYTMLDSLLPHIYPLMGLAIPKHQNTHTDDVLQEIESNESELVENFEKINSLNNRANWAYENFHHHISIHGLHELQLEFFAFGKQARGEIVAFSDQYFILYKDLPFFHLSPAVSYIRKDMGGNGGETNGWDPKNKVFVMWAGERFSVQEIRSAFEASPISNINI